MDNISALVVGCGSIGTRHARNLQTLGVDVLAYDQDESRRETAASDVDGTVVSSLSAAWGRDPDVVVVAVPNSYHVEVAQEAAEHGCDLFIEKPISHSQKGLSALTEEIGRRDLVTLVGCNMRFHPGLQTVSSLLADDVVGPITSVRIEGGSYLPEWHPDENYRDLYSARSDLGGGALLDYIHEIDYARWLFGDVTRVSCFMDTLSSLDIDVEDTAALLVRFADGTLGEIHVDYVQRTYSRSCKVIGEDGTIEWSWEDDHVRWYDADEDECHTEETPAEWTVNQMYVDEMEHFLSCVESRTETTCDVTEGWRALEVALAARESANTGQHVEVRAVG
jgi:predicted dehydrogenase